MRDKNMYSEDFIELNLAMMLADNGNAELTYLLKRHGAARVSIWGAGNNGRACAMLLSKSGIKVERFYDRRGSGEFMGIPVMPEPSTLINDACVIIAMNTTIENINRIRHLCRQADVPNILAMTDVSHASPQSRCLKLEQFVNIHAGKRCFVVGNGPSLNKINMKLLRDEITFGSNRCYLGFKQWEYQFKYWTTEDKAMAGWQAKDWRELQGMTKFLPEDLLSLAQPNDRELCAFNLCRIDFQKTPPLFSIYPKVLFSGRTVTYVLLQLAALMGCSPIYLVGVDFYFDVKTIKSVVTTSGDDIWEQEPGARNHFYPDYIPTGRFLRQAHWDLQKIAYHSAKHASKLYKFEIFNATPGSKLNVFKKVAFHSLFK